ncbi:hypothetical protein FRB94_010853 [Tulasnella sp. JGI-2019a]|nr:hypothetical protein FRB93_009757 [Tulasnella sp. JGI-2019a]KAG8993297.1 hypothetical protein FRB94_010853 [Tulasnella sp. JGI-2019a]
MRSTIIAIASVLSAALVSAKSATSPASGLQERSTSCSGNNFYYSTKNCCLPHGGISNTQCPSDRSCPSDWYYHPTYSCCVPKTSASPAASCNGDFSAWDTNDQCCKKPTTTAPAPTCSSGHFFYSTKSCCLPNGGPSTTPSCPSDRACPSDWYYHTTYSSCVPKNPNPPSTPTCNSGKFTSWDSNDQCCKQPTTPPPTPSGSIHKTRGQTKRATLARQVSQCLPDLQECPIKGSTEVECVDGNEDLGNCGGCTSLGKGQDCAAIKHVVGVTCMAATKGCQVSSCKDGYVPSTDATSCVPTLVSQ